MVRIRFIIIGLIFVFPLFSQIRFKQGYYINNEDDTIKCLIKDSGWEYNPESIVVKMSSDNFNSAEVLTIKDVKLFEIENTCLYVRALVKIDTSGFEVQNLSRQRNPEWKETQLFLKVLILGDASLYYYKKNNITRFFFRINQGEIQQLVYKDYIGEHPYQIRTNKYYCQQLLNEVNCNSTENAKNLGYTRNSLVNYFKKYNLCINNSFVEHKDSIQKKRFSVKAAYGINYSSVSVINYMTDVEFSFDNKISHEFGFEIEGILPFNKDKIRVVCLPTYKSFKSTGNYTYSFYTINSSIDYQSIDLPFGLRYYFFLTDNLKIFLTASLIPSFPLKSSSIATKSTLASENKNLIIRPLVNYFYGLGINYDKYSLELRYYTFRELTASHIYWSSEYYSWSFNLGYRLY